VQRTLKNGAGEYVKEAAAQRERLMMVQVIMTFMTQLNTWA